MIFNPASTNYSFLFFNETSKTLTNKLNLPLSSFPTVLRNLNSTQMKAVKLGSNCNLMMYGGKVYSISSSSVT